MRDPKTEAYLERGQFKYQYHKTVPFSEIDIDASKENPARLLRRIDEERCFHYAEQMQEGVDFPAIVLLNFSDNTPFKWIVATGVHRLTAAVEYYARDKKTGTIDAYCVSEPDVYRREVLFRQLNTLEGAGVPMAEQVLQALELHYQFKIPLKQLAKEWRLKESQLQGALNDRRARDRGLRLGSWDFLRLKWEKKAYQALNRIASDTTYKEATEVAIGHKMSSAEIDEMVDEIRQTKSEAEASKVIIQHREAAIHREQGAKARHARVSPIRANKMLSDAKRFMKHREAGLEHLHLSALDDPAMAIMILQGTIEAAREMKIELERISAIQQTMPGDKVVSLRA